MKQLCAKRWLVHAIGVLAACACLEGPVSGGELKRYLYCVQPDGSQGVGPGAGRGVVVVDLDDRFRFVKRIATPAMKTVAHGAGGGHGMRGIAICARSARLFYSWHDAKDKGDGVGCLDLRTDQVLWESRYAFSADRVELSVDGKLVYVPRHWTDRTTKKLYALAADTGEIVREYDTGQAWPKHPLVLHPDGKRIFWPGAAMDLASGNILWINRFGGDCHYTLDRTGALLYTGRHPEGKDVATWILAAATGEVSQRVTLDRARFPGVTSGVHEVVAFEAGGRRFWGEVGHPYAKDLGVAQFDNTVTPPAMLRFLALADLKRDHGYQLLPGHGHAMVAAAGDYVWFSQGLVLAVPTGTYVGQMTAEDGKPFSSAKHVEVTWIGDELVWAGQDEGHGFIYDGYPMERVRPLLPASSPLRQQPETKEETP